MNKKTRLLLLFLSCLLLLTSALSFVGCDKTPANEEGTTGAPAEEGTQDPWRDDLPAGLKFENEEIRFVIGEVSAGLGGTFAERSIAIDGYSLGDAGTNTVDEQVYYRNLNVEDRLGVVITPYALNDAVIRKSVYTDLRSGLSEYDVIAAYQAHDISMATEGLILNFNAMEQFGANYVDVDKEYWSKSYSEAIAYKDAMYWVTGDLSLRYLGGMYCTFVNLDIYNNALAETWGNIYDLVDNKGWNLDVMAQMIEQAWVSVDETPDETDTLGFVIEKIDPLDGMTLGAGVTFSTKDANGDVTITLADNKGNPNALTFAQKIYDILYGNNKGSLVMESNHSSNSMGQFAQGNVLFSHDKILTAEVFLTEMESYGIIPSPMLNEAQGAYRAGIHDGCSLYGIYSQSTQKAAAAATLEAMASMSDAVTTAYYDEALKYRYSRDPESAEMIDLIRDSVYVDFAFAWGRSLNNIHNYYRTAVNSETAPSVTTFKKGANGWNAKLELLLTALINQSGLVEE